MEIVPGKKLAYWDLKTVYQSAYFLNRKPTYVLDNYRYISVFTGRVII